MEPVSVIILGISAQVAFATGVAWIMYHMGRMDLEET